MLIARLAPQDYHRWHSPVSGKITRNTPIAGAYYSVNPLAINENVNVFTDNKREIVEIETQLYGKVILIAVGATMVGSITMLKGPGDHIKKGYFSFGGSTCSDQDLINSSNKRVETLVKVNTKIGQAS